MKDADIRTIAGVRVNLRWQGMRRLAWVMLHSCWSWARMGFPKTAMFTLELPAASVDVNVGIADDDWASMNELVAERDAGDCEVPHEFLN